MSRPTLKTVAARAGVSVPTVSRALSDAPDIGAATKAKVRAAAAEIGYVPDRAGVRLRTGRTQVIAFILPTEHRPMDLTAQLLTGVALGLQTTRYHLNVTPVLPDQDPMEPVRYVVDTGTADAIILNQVTPRDPRVAWLLKRGFPVVTHGRSDFIHGYADFDNAAFAAGAVAHLAASGRRNLLLVPPPSDQSYAAHLNAGAMQAAAGQGVTVRRLTGATIDSDARTIRNAVDAALRETPDLDGLILPAPFAAMAAISAFEGAGQRIGDTFDAVAKDAATYLDLFRAGITIVPEDITATGTFLARAAIHAIEHPSDPPMTWLDTPAAPASDPG